MFSCIYSPFKCSGSRHYALTIIISLGEGEVKKENSDETEDTEPENENRTTVASQKGYRMRNGIEGIHSRRIHNNMS